jgi:hypothetical protein
MPLSVPGEITDLLLVGQTLHLTITGNRLTKNSCDEH